MENFDINQDSNIVSQFDENTRRGIAQNISKRWAECTAEIMHLINESRESWNYYLSNRPDPDQMSYSRAEKLDSVQRTSQNAQRGLRLGWIPRSVDSVMSILHNNLFPADERFFSSTPRNDISRQYQELYESWKAENFAEDGATEELRKFLLTCCLDPAAALSVQWKQKTVKKVTYEAPKLKLMGGAISVPLPFLGLKRKEQEDYIDWEGTHLECLDFNDWRVDPTARSIDDAWFMRRWYEPTWKVEEQYGIKDVKPYYAAFDYPDDPLGNRKRLSYGLINPIPFSQEEDGKEYALMMVTYDDFYVDGKMYPNHVAITLNAMDTVYFGPNTYDHGKMPYVVSSLLPVPGQVYGLSLIRHAVPSAEIGDTIVDKILKISALAADPIFEVDVMEPAFRKTRQIKPGLTIPVKKAGSVRQVQINVTNLTLLETMLEKAESNVREVTGASQEVTGEDFTQQPANVTAFQVDQRTQAAAGRFQAIMNNVCNAVLTPILTMAFSNDQQYKTKTETVFTGSDTTQLTPEMIKQMDFKFTVTSGNATALRGKKLANMKELITGLLPGLVQAGIVQLSPDRMLFDQNRALKEMCVLAGIEDTDLLFKEIPGQPQQPGMMQQPGGMINGPQPLPQVIPGASGPLPNGPAGQPGGTTPQATNAGANPIQYQTGGA